MEKVIWSNFIVGSELEKQYLENPEATLRRVGYSEEDIERILKEYNYPNGEPEDMAYNIYQDPDLQKESIAKFYNNVVPALNSQTEFGIILAAHGTGKKWGNSVDTRFPLAATIQGMAINAEDLLPVNGELDNATGEKVEIAEDTEGNLYWAADGGRSNGRLIGDQWVGVGPVGYIKKYLYTIPTDHNAKVEFVKTCMLSAMENEKTYDPDITEEEAINKVIENLNDKEYINRFCNFKFVPNVCKNLKGFTLGESLEEAHTKNPENLDTELKELKQKYDEYGPEVFYNIPYEAFKNKYPEFYKSCIVSFLKELEILMPDDSEEDLANYWVTGDLIQNGDWLCLFDGANRLVNKEPGSNIQWEKLWEKHYKDFN